MTYCVAVKLDAGLVFLSDSRTNAGLDQIGTFRKMMVYEKHLADFSEQVKALEQQRTRLVERMETVGVFTALDVPDRVGPTWSRRSGK